MYYIFKKEVVVPSMFLYKGNWDYISGAITVLGTENYTVRDSDGDNITWKFTD